MSGFVPRTFLIRWAPGRAPRVPSVCPSVSTLYSSSPSFLRRSHPSPQLIHHQNDRREFFHPIIKSNLILDLLSDGFIPSATHHPRPCHDDACAREAQSPAGVAGSGAVSKWKALGNTDANDIQQPHGFQTKSCRRWGSGDGAVERTTPPPMALPHKTSPWFWARASHIW